MYTSGDHDDDDDDDVIEVLDSPSSAKEAPSTSEKPGAAATAATADSDDDGGTDNDDDGGTEVLDLSRDDSSVEIAAAEKKPPAAAKVSGGDESDDSDSDDDDDDELLFQSPVFKKKKASSASQKFLAAVGKSSSSAPPSSSSSLAPASLSRARSSLSSTASASSAAPSGGGGGGGVGGRRRNKKRSAEERNADRLSNEREKERRRAEREEEREQKKTLAEREKAEKKRRREEERAARVQSKLDERRAKESENRREKQAQGKFAKDEILAMVDLCLAEEEESGLGLELRKQLGDKGYTAVVPSRKGTDEGGADEADENEDWDAVRTGPGAGCVRWLRRDGVDGGARSLVRLVGGDRAWGGAEAEADAAADAGSSAAEESDARRMDMVAVVFYDPAPFLDMLVRHAGGEDEDEDDDYPLLRSWLRRVRTTLRTGFEARFDNDPEAGGGGGGARHRRASGNVAAESKSRLILVLKDVHKELNRRWNASGGGRRGRGGPRNEEGTTTTTPAPAPATESDLRDAIIWLLTEERVEAHATSGAEETAEYLTDMTRALSEAPYYEDATELHCVKKIKASVVDGDDDFSRARDAWRRMVQQLPGISEPKARKFVERYPTLASLVEGYGDEDLSEEGRRGLLTKCFAEGKNNAKLSEMMWRLMTSEDPEELI